MEDLQQQPETVIEIAQITRAKETIFVAFTCIFFALISIFSLWSLIKTTRANSLPSFCHVAIMLYPSSSKEEEGMVGMVVGKAGILAGMVGKEEGMVLHMA